MGQEVKMWRRSHVERLPRMRPSDRGSSPTHEMEDDRNNSKQQENVDKERSDVEHEKASQPQQQQNQSET